MKNKIITYVLAGIFIFTVVFLFLQVKIDKEKNNLNSDNFYVEIPTKEQTTENDFPVENIPHSEMLIKNDKYTIYDDKIYNLKDCIEFLIPSEDTIYEQTNTYTEITQGKMNRYEFQIVNYEFDLEKYILKFEIEAYSKDLGVKTIISSENFSVSYEGKKLENLNIQNYEITQGLTKINISYKFDENIDLKDINTTFFKFVYSDKFNIKEINLY